MLDIDDFDSVFHGNVYNNALVKHIQENKKRLGGKTFYERLLESVQIKWRKIYPPSNQEQLRDLHQRILDASIALHYKHCLVFYLLKDISTAYPDQAELASDFATSIYLDERFWTFVDGLWALDHLDCETAVSYLTHPSIIPTFPDEIMLVLLHQARASREPRKTVLPLAYYNCANPPLAGEQVRMDFVGYMSDRNVTEALYWIRARPEHEQRQLLELLIQDILDRASRDDGQEDVYPRDDKAKELVGLPLTTDEENWMEAFLMEGKGRNLRGAWDTVQIRRIATGKLQNAALDTSAKGRKHDHVNWEILRDGLRKGLGPRIDEDSAAFT
ncbi:hypothetical protein M011DRAFT_402495 [Sporormia fimetaria CBS 119925]|uniref:ELYS-like domain-containing protein n=1 Tax=Sporormia fimetaria CBS 119925 TaxID=1340428 RepID=A0A6A6VAA0_9PLEO|nr:hypothetical protein M011DRAFT_402495 [Sporormia fimetaria CBS 119925]